MKSNRYIISFVSILCLFYISLSLSFCFAQKKTQKITIDTIITPDSDGRFTLGTKNFRLMYGYPYPYSTSHFIININNKLATNRPYLKNITYLRGDLKTYFINNVPASTITFMFEGFRIIQTLTPVDKALNEVQKNTSTQYYHVSYNIENIDNNDKTKKRLALLMLFDTQIAENDACIMQTCKFDNIRKGKNFLDKILSLFSFGSQKKERLYKDNDTPEVVLVFKSEKRHKDITGAFILQENKATKPDEVLIGRWTFYKNMRWGYADPNSKNIEYDDSALILKWKEREAKPFEKHLFATYYGVLDLDTLKMQHTKPLEKIATTFKVVPDTIYVGDTAKLVWETKNPIKADVFITSIKNKLSNKGTLDIMPTKSQTYTLKLILQGKEIETQEDFLTVLPRGDKPKKQENKKQEITKNTTITNNKTQDDKNKAQDDKKFDGRFTIGHQDKNITFGYPFHFSTSHFVLKVTDKDNKNEKCASNYDHLGKNFSYIAGNITSTNTKGSTKTQVIYTFEGIDIIQKLIPYTKKNNALEPTKDNNWGQYYWVGYTFQNKSNAPKEIYFALMLDVMIGKDDQASILLNNKKISLNTKINQNEFSEKMFLVENFEENTNENPTNLNADDYTVLFFDEKKSQKPQEIFVGIWQYLNTASYDVSAIQKPFTDDTALQLKWQKQTINPKQNSVVGFYIGNPKANITALHHQKKPSVQHNIFFELNKFNLTTTSNHTLEKFIKQHIQNKSYTYLVIEGFTDKIGTAKLNYELSQNRVNTVKTFLVDNGVPENKILIKSHGQFFAGKKSDEQERRVSIMIYE